MVELSGDGTYWNINTAGIFKTSYGAKRNVVYNRHTTAKQSAETDEASLSGEQSGTTPLTRMNAPTQTSIDDSVSEGKLVWKHADDVSAASDVEQGLYSPQGEMSDPATEGTDAPQTNIKPIVFTRPALEPDTNTDTSGVDSGQSDGVTTPAGNSPQTSAGKVTEKENSVQTVDDKIEKGNTLQTAASQPHGGIALYRDILANVLISAGKDSDNPPSSQGLKERPLLWERGADFAPEDVATPTISTIEPQQGDETSSRTKGQSNASSAGKVTEKKFRANFYRKCGGGNGYRPERSAEESWQL